MISTIFQVIAIATFGAMLAWAVYNISRPTSKRGSKTITIMAILGMMGLSYYLFPVTDKAPPPPAPYAETNAAVLAMVKKGDLILCTDPATSRVTHALLVQSVAKDPRSVTIHGRFLDKDVFRETDSGIYPSYFNGCQVEAFRDDRLSGIDQKIGKIIRFGLNPPPPPK